MVIAGYNIQPRRYIYGTGDMRGFINVCLMSAMVIVRVMQAGSTTRLKATKIVLDALNRKADSARIDVEFDELKLHVVVH
ncbi:hypothetical protein IQ06DRAFT_64923 [Phaeosphaeriaceae sp. SRC1lsM3a]|nr:hypothetical protein IQ06DRAFT_64923 [Stagonospora sp. SRC1lsM3a]